MRVAHVVSRLDPSDGGPPAVVSHLAAAQRRAGHDVTIFASEPHDEPREFERAYGQIEGFNELELRFLPAHSCVDRWLGSGARRQLREALPSADFTHVHGIWRPHLLHAAAICRTQGVPYCVTPHGMLSTWTMRQKFVKKHLALAVAWRSALDGATFLQFLNPGERDQARELHLSAPDVIVPNGIDPAELDVAGPASGTPPEHRQRIPGRFVLFIGRLHVSKGLDVLADAFARIAGKHPDVDLVIVGPDFGYGVTLERRIHELGIASRCHLLGPLFGREKMALVQRAECLCLPSRQEGFSVTVLEALACGVPAVISNACNFDELERAGAGFVTAIDADAVARRLDLLCGNRVLRDRIGKSAGQLVRQRYTWNSLAAELTQHYASHLAGPGFTRLRHAGSRTARSLAPRTA